MRTMRTMAGPSPLARAGWIAGGGNKRCMSTVYAESHEYLTKVRERLGGVGVLLLVALVVLYRIQNAVDRRKVFALLRYIAKTRMRLLRVVFCRTAA